MKKHFVLSLFFSLIILSAHAQNFDEQYEMAMQAFDQNDLRTADSLVKILKPQNKSKRPKIIFLEIKVNMKLIEENPFLDFSLIENTRKITDEFIKKNQNNIYQNDNLKTAVSFYNELKQYPADRISFNNQKANLEKQIAGAEARKKNEEEQRRLLAVKIAAEAEARKLAEVENEKKRVQLEKDLAERNKVQAENDKRNKAEQDKIVEIQRRVAAEERRKFDSLSMAEAQKKQAIDLKKNKRKLKPFKSLGFQSGEIAKYGLLFESGGAKTLGFHISARTSLTDGQAILNGETIPNKTQIEMGPNIKLAKFLYMNIGAGYGFYNANVSNDYAGTKSVEKFGYLVTTACVMIRISNTININAGASFMDIDKDIYKPEIVFGLSFNLKK
jgi:hypothetical protein